MVFIMDGKPTGSGTPTPLTINKIFHYLKRRGKLTGKLLVKDKRVKYKVFLTTSDKLVLSTDFEDSLAKENTVFTEVEQCITAFNHFDIFHPVKDNYDAILNFDETKPQVNKFDKLYAKVMLLGFLVLIIDSIYRYNLCQVQ